MKYGKLMIPVAALFALSSCSQSVTGNAAGSQNSTSSGTVSNGNNAQVSSSSTVAKPDNKTKQVEVIAPVSSEKAASPVN